MTDSQLDTILALQIVVAWAGEGKCEPPRLSWWQSDVVDPQGGGSLFARLLPHTHRWASLEAVLEIARRHDNENRRKLSDADQICTIFFLGFETDEDLAGRMKLHVRSGKTPEECLPLPVNLSHSLSKTDLEKYLNPAGESSGYRVVPGGRQLKGEVPPDPVAAAHRLAEALVPLPEQYPLPFYRLKG
ncbi:MAG: BREX-6 system BrxE protein [Deltaproteobacteria bacterium]|nr:BREX-6 system BrxE protein [Deltaproteobacteria bacterium]